jgi:adenosylcobinamide-GDP ribazoletransferase
MAMRKEIKNLFAFLTVLPLRMDMDCLADSAKLMWLFPLVGAIIGLISGVFGWAISQLLPGLVVGAITLGVLLLLTGLHHTDGLLDFGDAVMYHGTPERKIEIMHDQLTGAGAIGLGFMTYIITGFAFGELGRSVTIFGVSVPLIIPALIIVEACAKLAMVVGAWAGKSVHQGMNSPFLEAMHGGKGSARMMASVVLALILAVALLQFAGFVSVLAAFLTGIAMVAVAHRHFKGVTGDVLGATNELTRMVCVVVLLAVVR